MQSRLRTAVVVSAALTLSSAPAALARPADEGSPSPSTRLSPTQLRAINGHQPPDPLPAYPGAAEPVVPVDDGSGFPWVLVAIPLAVAGAAGGAGAARRHTHLRLRGTVPGA